MAYQKLTMPSTDLLSEGDAHSDCSKANDKWPRHVGIIGGAQQALSCSVRSCRSTT
jgi:hypothetical protein